MMNDRVIDEYNLTLVVDLLNCHNQQNLQDNPLSNDIPLTLTLNTIVCEPKLYLNIIR